MSALEYVSPSDRRTAPRIRIAGEVPVLIGRGQGVLMDLSERGAKVRHRTVVRRGGSIRISIEWKGTRHAIEVKVRRDTQTEERALDQVAGYLDSLGLAEGWLILFDLRSTQPWSDRLLLRDVEHAGKHLHIVGC